MLVAFDAVEGSTDAQCSAPAEERESEVSLSKEIVALWSTHQDGKASAKRTREDLKAIRSDLGERLHAMKALLARTGRGVNGTCARPACKKSPASDRPASGHFCITSARSRRSNALR